AVLEPEQQRIAAELEQARAVVVGDRENRLEALADHLGDLLRAFAAFAGELLRKPGEARDVGEDGGARVRPPAVAGIRRQVLLQDARGVETRARDICGRS